MNYDLIRESLGVDDSNSRISKLNIIDPNSLKMLVDFGHFNAKSKSWSKFIIDNMMILDHRISNSSFNKSIKTMINNLDDDYSKHDALWIWNTVKVIPDGYFIDIKNRTLICYEIEDGHPLDENGFNKYVTLWHALDCVYHDLILVTFDAYCNRRIIDLLSVRYYQIKKKKHSG